MAVAVLVLVIEDKGYRTVRIVIDTMLGAFRKLLCDKGIRNKFLGLVFIVSCRAELVGIVTLYASVSCSDDDGKLGDRGLATLEVFTYCRLKLEFP